MKFSCSTPQLQQSLSLVARAIASQQALPILGNVLLEVEGKKCKLSATDLELSIITSIDAEVEVEGSITIPAKALANFAQYNADPTVLLEVKDGNKLHCTSDSAKTLIAGESAEEYPTISPITKETSFSLDTKLLVDALDLVTFSSARTTLRPVLAGVYIRAEKDSLILVATDSYRLSEISIPGAVSGEEISCIVPTKVLEEVRGILGSKKTEDKMEKKEEGELNREGMIDITLSAQQIEIKINETTLLSRLIEGKFPDYKQIIPKEKNTTLVVPTKELTTAVKRMHYFAKEINNNLTFDVKSDGVHISTPQTQAGQDEATIPTKTTGEPVKIALSSLYLLDFLSHISDEEVTMTLTDSLHPAVFNISTREEFLHLVMPLRIQD